MWETLAYGLPIVGAVWSLAYCLAARKRSRRAKP